MGGRRGGCEIFSSYVLVSQAERRIEVRTREGDGWTVRVARQGESTSVHGREIAVDAIYA